VAAHRRGPGDALSERVSGAPKTRVNQVFPGPLAYDSTNGKGDLSERQENMWPKIRVVPSFSGIRARDARRTGTATLS